MVDRRKIKVNRLELTPEQLKKARDRASKDFKKLIVWKDTRPVTPKDGE